MNGIRRLVYKFLGQERVLLKLDAMHRSLGRIERRQLLTGEHATLTNAEFQVSSQWGEDGIIQSLIHQVPISRKVFIEFGIGDYTEANTRFLVENDNWAGLVMDSSQEGIASLRRDPIYWKYNIKAQLAFITRENINGLIRDSGITGDIGLMSIDIDGNDYWVWEAIDCVSPRIVVAEYNGIFGPDRAVTVPYDPGFSRGNVHYSHLYWGASLSALCNLARRKGYNLVGSNSAGTNAFFVRVDCGGAIRPLDSKEAFVQAQCRETRDASGRLTFLTQQEGRQLISDLPLFDLEEEKLITVDQITP